MATFREPEPASITRREEDDWLAALLLGPIVELWMPGPVSRDMRAVRAHRARRAWLTSASAYRRAVGDLPDEFDEVDDTPWYWADVAPAEREDRLAAVGIPTDWTPPESPAWKGHR